MASTYLDMLAKMQAQGLETLKQTQGAYLESLSTARKMIEKLPAPQAMPAIEGMPTVAELTELNSQFLDRVVEQQKTYAKQLADVFAPITPAAV
jgi:hypothetical protein